MLLLFQALFLCGLLRIYREEDDLQSPFPYSLCLKGVPYFWRERQSREQSEEILY